MNGDRHLEGNSSPNVHKGISNALTLHTTTEVAMSEISGEGSSSGEQLVKETVNVSRVNEDSILCDTNNLREPLLYSQ